MQRDRAVLHGLLLLVVGVRGVELLGRRGSGRVRRRRCHRRRRGLMVLVVLRRLLLLVGRLMLLILILLRRLLLLLLRLRLAVRLGKGARRGLL